MAQETWRAEPPISWLHLEPAQAGSDPKSSSLDDSLIARVQVGEGLHPELGAGCRITEGPRHGRHRLMLWLSHGLKEPID